MPFIRGYNPIWSEVDLSGRQFDDTFWLFVLQNQFPYLPAKVYHDPDGLTEWDNPIQFLANGTLPPDIYFDSGSAANPVIYRLEFRKGNTQADPLIYLVENYIPGNGTGNVPSTVGFSTDNQITNPQFAEINFTSPYTLTTSSSPTTLEIAPGWTLLLNTIGTGSVTLTQVPLNSTQKSQTNAPYALQIDLSGWSSVILRQRFNQNGMLWSNKYVSCSVTARNSSGSEQISAFISPSVGAPVEVLPTTFLTGSFIEYTGHGLIGDSTNTDLPPNAYIDFLIVLPVAGTVFLTSFQLVAADVEVEFEYEQDSIERQIDQTYHYWDPLLKYKPIPSYLVGWDFAMNPAQETGDSISPIASGANTSYAAWDQTVLFQSANSGISVSRDAFQGGIILTASATTQMAIIQYLPASEARRMAINNLAVNVNTSVTATTTMCVSLWYTTAVSLPSLASNRSLVTFLNSQGYPSTVASNWFEIKKNFGPGFFTPTLTSYNNFSLSGWIADQIPQTATFFAIVVGTSSVTAGNSVAFSSISLVPGDIATIPAPQTPDEVLRECQYYYETSGNYLAASLVNAYRVPMAIDVQIGPPVNVKSFAAPFTLNYRVKKRATPTFSVSSTSTGAPNNITSNLFYNPAPGGAVVLHTQDQVFATYFSATIGTSNINCVPLIITPLDSQTNNTGNTFASSDITFQYNIDARLGFV